MFQYEACLRKAGLDVERSPFFSDEYLERLYAGQQARSSVMTAYRRRLARTSIDPPAELLWVEKEAFPWFPFRVERALLGKSMPIVTDFDDAIFHSYDLHRRGWVRWLLASKIDRLMAASEIVFAGNAYLASRAQSAGARRIEIVPTVVDIESYRVGAPRSRSGAVIIGWIGTPSTWTEYLEPMLPMLLDVADGESGRVKVVGAGKSVSPHPLLDFLPWAEEAEVEQIQAMDIGIMPLTDTPWARGKCGYKLIQYMACGLPVVASPVGVNSEIVEHGVNGFLASTEGEWQEALVTLLRDPDLRRKMGAEGRRKVEAHYSLQVWGPRVAQMLKDVVEARHA